MSETTMIDVDTDVVIETEAETAPPVAAAPVYGDLVGRLWPMRGRGACSCPGPIEGANTKVKLLKRQMRGRASFALLRQRILLG